MSKDLSNERFDGITEEELAELQSDEFDYEEEDEEQIVGLAADEIVEVEDDEL
ncbi:hypothetical protein [Abyssicoccus albus]|uniref:Uncharacterized protein n=1 Tax=Abyssicoccus albus TaxID=1817405 RepID=A0A3N5C5N3_9BACL|nr:hypothetical protein [Abyssicoccus albus]RPF54722.1 hypothetical protein EDD62_1682 [Abyssicoccus albus]